MEKTKIVILAAALAVLTVVAVAGIAFAQSLSTPTYPPQAGTVGQAPNAGYFGGARCPVLGGYVSGYGGYGVQNGYVAQPRGGMGGGMMGGFGW